MSTYTVPLLPLPIELETKAVLKKVAQAHRALAELKGVVTTIPNESILISTLSLQEAKDSSAIENIVTTHDELFQSDAFARQFASIAAKEVHSYANALRNGFEQVRRTGILTSNYIVQIQQSIESNNAGFRKVPGTALKNDRTGQVVYTPPQHPDQIVELMNNLEAFINDDALCDWDDLVKMAVIHHQFESIHPFYDGNGRTGRIINILYLVKQGLLQLPVLYLSRYINQHKGEYYRLLQQVRTGNMETDNHWEEWLLFMLDGVEKTSYQTIALVQGIKSQMQTCKDRMRSQLPKIYSHELLNNLFRHPYTKIEFVMNDLQVTRQTASTYLKLLVDAGFLSLHRIRKENYYINDGLVELFLNVHAPAN
jgi:Fic family protein